MAEGSSLNYSGFVLAAAVQRRIVHQEAPMRVCPDDRTLHFQFGTGGIFCLLRVIPENLWFGTWVAELDEMTARNI